MKIINHNSASYLERNPYDYQHRNGAFIYSQEICKNIIPLIKTNRPWVTVNDYKSCFDNAIVFIHNNLNPQNYEWLSKYEDLILVCGLESTCEKVAHLGRTIYLPLSVDIQYVEKFKQEKIYDRAYVGRSSKLFLGEIPPDTLILSGMPRELLLPKMARFDKVYAVGRCAIEAKILGCEVLPYDYRFPDPSVWKVLDNKDAAMMLQEKLDALE